MLILLCILELLRLPGCSRGDDSAESGGGGAGSSPRSEEGGVPIGIRGHTSSASVKSESPASPLPHGLHTPAHQVRKCFFVSLGLPLK